MTSDPVDNKPPMLEFTGERFVPESEGDIALEHLHRYLIARELASGKVVLDIACGEGYGCAMLAEVGSRVVGVDISEETVAHARRRYRNENLEFYEGRADAIPLSERSVDLVVSFETIEHHDKHTEMVAEIHRVLRPEGLLIISSPDKLEYSDVRVYSNPFHVKELYLEEFESLLRKHFQNVAILGQRICYGSVIASDRVDDAFSSFVEQDGAFTREGGIPRPLYFVAVASNAPLPAFGTSFYEVNIECSEKVKEWADTVDARDREIAEFTNHLAAVRKKRHDDEVKRNIEVMARDRQIAALNQAVEEGEQRLRELEVNARDRQLAVLNQEVADRIQQLRELEVNARDCQIAALNQAVAERDQQLRELEIIARDRQIAALNQAVEERDQQLRALWESTSWRVTKPMRSISYALQRLLRR